MDKAGCWVEYQDLACRVGVDEEAEAHPVWLRKLSQALTRTWLRPNAQAMYSAAQLHQDGPTRSEVVSLHYAMHAAGVRRRHSSGTGALGKLSTPAR